MARVPLKSGAYEARSIIANAQRCVNLYGEANPEDAPAPFSFYPTPGLVTLGTPGTAGRGRGLYTASNGLLYAVAGQILYLVQSDWSFVEVGTLGTVATTPVSMVDNQTDMIVVDSYAGYTVKLLGNAFATIADVAFYSANRVDFADTYFILNKPKTGQFYTSNSNSTGFNALNFATKIGYSDLLATTAVVHREVWLLGNSTSEVWVNSGAADFPFQIMSGSFIQHGCAAVYSVAQMGDALFWISQDAQGGRVVVKGQGYQAQRISTHAIEYALAGYSTVSDAIGFAYQQEGHQFYVLTFPTADKTWCFDLTTQQWHERAWLDGNGIEHRHRACAAAYAYGVNVVQDWETGALYRLDLDAYTDAGAPILRRRGFPHMTSDGKRVFYRQFTADMQVGADPGNIWQGLPAYSLGRDSVADTALGPDVVPVFLGVDGGSFVAAAAQVYLRYSDTRGASWSDPIASDLGHTGEFLQSMQYQRLGMARDRVFELFWSAPVRTALNGAFVDAKVAGS